GFERPVVDGFRLLDVAKGPGADHAGRCQGNPDRVEFLDLALRLDVVQQIFHGLSSAQCVLTGCQASRTGLRNCRQSLSKSISMPRERISLIRTLNDSGMPASMR